MAKQVKEKKNNQFYDIPPNSIIRKLFEENPEYSKEALKEKLVVSMEAIRLWIAGYSRPEISKLKDIAEFFGVSIDYLFGNTESKSIDIGEIAIGNLTGLSHEAVRVLKYANGTLPEETVDANQEAYLQGRHLDKRIIDCINEILKEVPGFNKHRVLDCLKLFIFYDGKCSNGSKLREDDGTPMTENFEQDDYLDLRMIQLNKALKDLWERLIGTDAVISIMRNS